MKTSITTILLILSTTIAKADGFYCQTGRGLNIQVYNHTQASQGTRTASVMIISEASVNHGSKTIAKFSDIKGTLTSEGTTFEANVDLRFADSRRQGEWIAGTKLGYVDRIYLHVNHSYNRPVAAGTKHEGLVEILKRDGTWIADEAVCARYLKN